MDLLHSTVTGPFLIQIVVYHTDAPSKNACHSEEARRADVGIPIDIPEIWRGLPRQSADWLAMTRNFSSQVR